MPTKAYKRMEWRVDGYDTEHDVGNKECPDCWAGPWPCEDCGKGLLHSTFVDESYDSVLLAYRCDNCENESPPD